LPETLRQGNEPRDQAATIGRVNPPGGACQDLGGRRGGSGRGLAGAIYTNCVYIPGGGGDIYAMRLYAGSGAIYTNYVYMVGVIYTNCIYTPEGRAQGWRYIRNAYIYRGGRM
jgi:hypothetical protein